MTYDERIRCTQAIAAAIKLLELTSDAALTVLVLRELRAASALVSGGYRGDPASKPAGDGSIPK